MTTSTPVDVIEQIEMVARFMGYELKQGKDLAQHISGGHEWYWVGEYFTELEGMYAPNANWIQLMPVLEKISQHHYGWDKKEDEWDDTAYPRTFGMRDKDGLYMVRLNAQPLFSAPTLIEAAWQAVVHFIANNQSKEK